MGDTADVGGSTAAGGGEAGAGRPPSPPLSSSEVPVTRAEPASKRTEAPAGSSGVSPAHAPGQTWTEGATAPFTAGVVNIAVIPLRGPIRQEQLDRLAGGLTVLGLITIALGTVAIAAPLLFSLVIEQFLGVLFVLGGVVQVVHGLQLCGVSAPGCSMNLLGGAINLFVGAWLITSPVDGLAGLTILIAAWFFAQGLTKLVLTYQVRHLSTWPSVLVSGVLSLVLSVLILAQWPENAGWVVGVLVGVDFIVTGISLALLGCMAKLGRDMDQAQLGLPTDPLLAERDD